MMQIPWPESLGIAVLVGSDNILEPLLLDAKLL